MPDVTKHRTHAHSQINQPQTNSLTRQTRAEKVPVVVIFNESTCKTELPLFTELIDRLIFIALNELVRRLLLPKIHKTRKQEGMLTFAPSLRRGTKQNDFTIKLSPDKGREGRPPTTTTTTHCLTDLCRQKGRPPLCISNYSNNFTSPPEGPRIMSPPVNYPHAFSTFHWRHTGGVTLN